MQDYFEVKIENWYYDNPLTGERSWFANQECAVRDMYDKQFLDSINLIQSEVKLRISKLKFDCLRGS